MRCRQRVTILTRIKSLEILKVIVLVKTTGECVMCGEKNEGNRCQAFI